MFSHLVPILVALAVHSALVRTARAALESGTYRTVPGATATEFGDRVPNKSRVVPFTAIVTLDLSAPGPSLLAQLPDAVLEGRDPFPLTIRSSSVLPWSDGSYRFMGDFLREIQPSGSQYLFDWKFTASTNGQVVLNGSTGWAGGHIWEVTMTNIILLPDNPTLAITQADSQVTISWPATASGFQLQKSSALPATSWIPVDDPVVQSGDRFFVTMEATSAQEFFRLRKL